MKYPTLGQWSAVFALLSTLIVNALANLVPFNNQTTAQVSDKYPIFFMPAGYVFSIWGLIYIGLIAYVIYQLSPRRANDLRLKAIRPYFLLSCLANSIWLLLWHYDMITGSVITMAILVMSVLIIYMRLRMEYTIRTRLEKWCVDIPFSVYLGWVTVASIANVSAQLYSYQWNGWGISEQMWAAIMLIVASLITLMMITIWQDRAYGLVIIWAFIGIVAKFPDTMIIANTALTMTGIICLAILILTYIHILHHSRIHAFAK